MLKYHFFFNSNMLFYRKPRHNTILFENECLPNLQKRTTRYFIWKIMKHTFCKDGLETKSVCHLLWTHNYPVKLTDRQAEISAVLEEKICLPVHFANSSFN